MLGVLDKEMRCQWLATFTGPSPDFRKVCLFRLVFGDHISYLEVRDGGCFKWLHYGPDKVEGLVEELRRKGYTEEWNRECYTEPVEAWVERLKRRIEEVYGDGYLGEKWAIRLYEILEHQKRYYGWSWAGIIGIWFERLGIWRGLLSWEQDALAELIVKHIEREAQKQAQTQEEGAL
jgi:hypothetical protein